jgi:hypothetical protein
MTTLSVMEAPHEDFRTAQPGQTGGSVSDLASLFVGLSTLIGALGTAVSAIIIALRVPRRAAVKAAEGAVSKVLGENDDDDEATKAAMQAVLAKLLEQTQNGGGS